VTTTFLRKVVQRLRTQALGDAVAQADDLLEALRADPAAIFTRAGLKPDDWQADVLRSEAARLLFLCSRQSGKSFCASALALHTALTEPDSLILLLSPTERQSGELFRDKLLRLWRRLGEPLRRKEPTALTMELSNNSRVVALPDSEKGVRCFSAVKLLVIDEASRVSDDLYHTVRPMLATSKGRLCCLSTPYGMAGWFHSAWEGPEAWKRVQVTADQCPRISKEFLAEERRTLGEAWFMMEYFCRWMPLLGSVFAEEDIAAAFAAGAGRPGILWE
jgi:hypothetical protein